MSIWEDMNAARIANAQKQNSGGNDKVAQATPTTQGADNTWAQYTQPGAASSNFGQAVASAVAPAYQDAPIYQALGTVALSNPEPEKKEEPKKEEKDNKPGLKDDKSQFEIDMEAARKANKDRNMAEQEALRNIISNIFNETPNSIKYDEWGVPIKTESSDATSSKDSKSLDDSGGVAKEFKTYIKGLEDEESQEPGKEPIDPEALIYGLNRADYMNSSQRDQFLAAMRDEAMKEYYENKYGADVTNQDIGYEWFRDLGDSLDYQESKHDLVRDLFGYADEEGNIHGIEDWQNLARGSGIDLSGDDEQDIQNILEYMWGKENIIDPTLYFNDENYSNERNLSETGTSSRAMADYLLTQYGGIDPEALSAITGGLDMKDISAMIAAGDIMNNAGLRFGDTDLQDISNMLGFGGDKAKFNFTDNEEDAFNWQADEGRSYNAANVYNSIKNAIDAYNEAMANNGTLPDGKNVADLAPLYDIYDQEGVDSPINAHLADDLMAAISGKSGKLIARS